MKRKLHISILTLFLILNWSCIDNSKSRSEIVSDLKKDSILKNSETNSVKTKLTKYNKKWVEYVDESGTKIMEMELYISEFGDTLCWNRKIYKNGILDFISDIKLYRILCAHYVNENQ